jgi:hypothetical protein
MSMRHNLAQVSVIYSLMVLRELGILLFTHSIDFRFRFTNRLF